MPEKKILIVDTDVASRNFIARNLMAQKYEVIQAGSGKEGLICAWRDRPDLIVIDPTVPDLKGEELATRLRQDARTTSVPMVALSSDPSVMRIKSCMDAGFNEYITKSGQAVSTLNEPSTGCWASRQPQPNRGDCWLFLPAPRGAQVHLPCVPILP